METLNFNSVNENSTASSDVLVNMALGFSNEAAKAVENTTSGLAKKMAQEVHNSYYAALKTTESYMVYVNANAAEKWLEKCLQYVEDAKYDED